MKAGTIESLQEEIKRISLCKVLKCTKTPTAAEFTLHGVWPISGGGKLPCSSQPYDSTILKPLEKDLVKFWPSFIYQKDDQFWSHEWSKHGTCSGHSLFDYFKLSVALAKNQCLKIKDDLRISAIVPSATQTHAMKDYEQGIATAYGMGSVYQIVCQKDSSFAYLVEVRLCVDSSMQQLIFCPQSPGDKFPGCSDATGLVKALFYA